MKAACLTCPFLSEFGKCKAAELWLVEVGVCPHTKIQREITGGLKRDSKGILITGAGHRGGDSAVGCGDSNTVQGLQISD